MPCGSILYGFVGYIRELQASREKRQRQNERKIFAA